MLKIVFVAAVALTQMVAAGPLDNHSHLRSNHNHDSFRKDLAARYYQDDSLNLRSNPSLRLNPQQLNDLRQLNDAYLRRSDSHLLPHDDASHIQHPYLRSIPDNHPAHPY